MSTLTDIGIMSRQRGEIENLEKQLIYFREQYDLIWNKLCEYGRPRVERDQKGGCLVVVMEPKS